MILGKLRNRRVMIEDEADASTLRNKGSLGRNVGQKLSLDLMTSLDLLLRKKIEVMSGTEQVNSDHIVKMLSQDEMKVATAYHFLKIKGLKPVIKKGTLFSSGTRVMVFRDSESIDFENVRASSCYLAITDSEGSCLLYSVSRLPMKRKLEFNDSRGTVSERRKHQRLIELLESRGLKVASGLKFGSEFRIYEKESSHARYLMTFGSISLARDLAAKVRIAQSVRKTFVQACFLEKKREILFLEIKWNRL